jgi:hypothetical protein
MEKKYVLGEIVQSISVVIIEAHCSSVGSEGAIAKCIIIDRCIWICCENSATSGSPAPMTSITWCKALSYGLNGIAIQRAKRCPRK